MQVEQEAQAQQHAQLALLQQHHHHQTQAQYAVAGQHHHQLHAAVHFHLAPNGAEALPDDSGAAAAGMDPQQAAELAAAQQQAAEMGAQGITVSLPILAAGDLPLGFDPATIAAATAAGTAVTIPLSMLEALTPEHLQMLGASNGERVSGGRGLEPQL